MSKRRKRHKQSNRPDEHDVEGRLDVVADHLEAHSRELIDHESRLTRLERQARRRSRSSRV